MTLLAAMAAHFRDRHALDADLVKPSLDRFEP
jgi:hypothetical protein